MLRLSDLLKGEEAIITGFVEGGQPLARLRDMGLLEGTSLRVVKFAPFGDPIEIKARGYYLSLRKSAARQIYIKRK